jgi:lipopolysaccharide export system permease protein
VIGRTLSFYLAQRFARTVIASFMLVFVLIYAVDLVELLRRSGDSQRATGVLMADLSFLRTPTSATQALPFAVLFGSMIAFLNLSRKMLRRQGRFPRAPGSGGRRIARGL